MHTHAMDATPPAAQALMACLGEESRFRLVQALMGGARCVTDLAAEIGLSQSCTTRHLQALERRRVVSGTRDGKRVLYRIREDDPRLMPLLGWALASQGGAARARPHGRTRGERWVGSAAPPGPVAPPEPAAARGAPEPATPAIRPADPPAPVAEPEPRPTRPSRNSDIEDFLL